MDSSTEDLSASGDNVLNLEEQKPRQWQKEELEKELYDVSGFLLYMRHFLAQCFSNSLSPML